MNSTIELKDVNLTGAWGGISLLDGTSLIPNGSGGLALMPKLAELSPDASQADLDAWQKMASESQQPVSFN